VSDGVSVTDRCRTCLRKLTKPGAEYCRRHAPPQPVVPSIPLPGQPTDAELIEMLLTNGEPWAPQHPLVKLIIRWIQMATYWRERCMVLEERVAYWRKRQHEPA
jgi:hypothetical protein